MRLSANGWAIGLAVLVSALLGASEAEAARPSQVREVMAQSARKPAVWPSDDLAAAKGKFTQAQREDAAARLQELKQVTSMELPQTDAAPLFLSMPAPGATPDYYGVANWAFSPPLRKFVDTLPGLTAGGMNNLGQYIPIAVPDTTTYPGSDYYEIELGQYTEQMHSDLMPTTLRGYRQTNTADPTVSKFHYLGPLIIAERDRAVRIKFTNKLPTGMGGDLFLPVDTTVMGSGQGPQGGRYTQNRATLHLHGGRTPWISDGTAHQWITPAGEATPYKRGASVSNVPDMPDPGEGSLTFYWTNQQSARLLFYHDHAWGITRLNVYAGEAAGYLLQDPEEAALVASGVLPAEQIPLVIQDRTFVDAATVLQTDPTWAWGSMPGIPVTGDLWYPHVYVPAQNPFDLTGANAFGRWHYGPWFWPPTTGITHGPVPNPLYDCGPGGPCTRPWQAPENPGVPNVSMPGEAFMDTPVVNGTAFPSLTVQPKAYRFRVLNGSDDRFWNLQLYVADPTVVASDGRTNTEVRMVPADATPGFPANWPVDGRVGGVPDPAAMGPDFIQVATEGGFLPEPVVIPQQPIAWNTNPTTFNFGNVNAHALLLGPAERADVVIDFSAYAGQTLILYNDAPAAFPALDPRYDYYTGAPDLTSTGGHWGPQAGFGPNTRTVMQIKVAAATPAPAYDLGALQAAFLPTATRPGLFERDQDPIIVGQSAYDAAYGTTFPSAFPYWGIARIQDFSLSFQTVLGAIVTNLFFHPKAIHDEMGAAFDLEYGRMSGKLGVELPVTNAQNQNFVLQGFIDPATEIMAEGLQGAPVGSAGDNTQIWKITHNGVDTHPMHFHLWDVQVLNRVAWDGGISLPDPNELGWKDTVRISPLEDTIVALRPITPKQPFGCPDSVRLLDPSSPQGSTVGFANIDPYTGMPLTTTVTNEPTNFGWEYTWHCHILSHEEMDMMRPVVYDVASALPKAPVLAVTGPGPYTLTWTDGTPGSAPTTIGNPANEIGFRVERATTLGGPFSTVTNGLANSLTYTDAVPAGAHFVYRVVAYNVAGEAPSNEVEKGVPLPAGATGLVAKAQGAFDVLLTWTDASNDEQGFRIERAVPGGAYVGIGQVGVNTTSYVDTAVIDGVLLSYRVVTFNAGGDAVPSNVVTIQRPLRAPSSLAASLSTSAPLALNLKWADNSRGETGYTLQRATNATFTMNLTSIPLGANTSVYSDTAVAKGATYYYRVRAVSGAVVSGWSATAGVAAVAPARPTNLTVAVVARPTGNVLQLNWADNSTNEGVFHLQRALNLAFTQGLVTYKPAANLTTYTDTAVKKGVRYYYRIRSSNGAGESAWSNIVNALP